MIYRFFFYGFTIIFEFAAWYPTVVLVELIQMFKPFKIERIA